MTDAKRIRVTFDVATESQAAELQAAWQEILSGKRTRLNTAAEDLNEITASRNADPCHPIARSTISLLTRHRRSATMHPDKSEAHLRDAP